MKAGSRESTSRDGRVDVACKLWMDSSTGLTLKRAATSIILHSWNVCARIPRTWFVRANLHHINTAWYSSRFYTSSQGFTLYCPFLRTWPMTARLCHAEFCENPETESNIVLYDTWKWCQKCCLLTKFMLGKRVKINTKQEMRREGKSKIQVL